MEIVQPAGPWRRRVIVRAISTGRRRDSPSDPRRVYVLPPLPEDDADEHEHRRQVHQEDPEDRAGGRSKLLAQLDRVHGRRRRPPDHGRPLS